jgi:uncharacterized protein with FMN-binding domain
MAQRSSGKKVANSLVAMSSAAVLAVYSAGYERTRSAAHRLEAQTAERRPPAPEQPQASPPAAVPLTLAVPDKPKLAAAVEPPPSTPKEVPPSPEPSVAAAIPAAEPLAARAEEPAPAPPTLPPPASAPPPASPGPVWKDGTYTGWGSSRHGDIQASVVIEGGRIASATIAQCLTRYSCSVIEKLPPEVAQRQSPEVDFVSGATQSTNAFYFAVVDALGKAKSQTTN